MRLKTIVKAIVIGFVALLVVWGVISWVTTPTTKTVTFRIVVESDTSWSGAFGTIEEGQRTIEGSGGRTIYFKGTICSATVQKQTDYGYLRVSIYVGDTLKATQETTAAYGVVSVSASA